jgi:hypothetical protein
MTSLFKKNNLEDVKDLIALTEYYFKGCNISAVLPDIIKARFDQLANY